MQEKKPLIIHQIKAEISKRLGYFLTSFKTCEFTPPKEYQKFFFINQLSKKAGSSGGGGSSGHSSGSSSKRASQSSSTSADSVDGDQSSRRGSSSGVFGGSEPPTTTRNNNHHRKCTKCSSQTSGNNSSGVEKKPKANKYSRAKSRIKRMYPKQAAPSISAIFSSGSSKPSSSVSDPYSLLTQRTAPNSTFGYYANDDDLPVFLEEHYARRSEPQQLSMLDYDVANERGNLPKSTFVHRREYEYEDNEFITDYLNYSESNLENLALRRLHMEDLVVVDDLQMNYHHHQLEKQIAEEISKLDRMLDMESRPLFRLNYCGSVCVSSSSLCSLKSSADDGNSLDDNSYDEADDSDNDDDDYDEHEHDTCSL